MKPKVIVIVGPTASGKTSLGIELAKKLDGEIVSCDSMQIYKDMNIGTAKPTNIEQDGIKHYLIDFVSPDKRYTVSDYRQDAKKAIAEILEKKKVPIIVGGTGLYVESLIYEIEYPKINTDENYRKELEERAKTEGLKNLYEEALRIDEEAMKKISPNDQKRILRVLEMYHDTGKTKTELEILSRQNEVPYDYHLFGINMPKEVLYERIDKRVDIMINDGLIEEVKALFQKYDEFPTAMQGIGYKEIKEYLNEKISKEEAIEKIKLESKHYAKRQMTWFKKYKELIWIDGQNSMEDKINVILNNLQEVK